MQLNSNSKKRTHISAWLVQGVEGSKDIDKTLCKDKSMN